VLVTSRESRGCNSELIKSGLNYRKDGQELQGKWKGVGCLERGGGGNSSGWWFGQDRQTQRYLLAGNRCGI